MASEPAEPTTRQDPELWWSPTMGAIRRFEDHIRVYGGGTGNYWGSFLYVDFPSDAVQLVLADPAQTTELAIARCQTSCDDDCEAPCHEGHEVLTRRHHDVDECEAGQKRWAEMRAERDGYYRQWMSTRETVHKRTAERDALSLLLRGMARKLVAYRKWTSGETPTIHRLFDALRREADTADDITLSAIRLMNRAGQERDQAIAERDALLPRLAELAEQAGKLRSAEWLRTCASLPIEEWPPAPAYKGPMVPAAERDERQARIDAALVECDREYPIGRVPIDEVPSSAQICDRIRAALVGDQPPAEEPKPIERVVVAKPKHGLLCTSVGGECRSMHCVRCGEPTGPQGHLSCFPELRRKESPDAHRRRSVRSGHPMANPGDLVNFTYSGPRIDSWRHYDDQTVFAFNMAVVAPIVLAPWITGSDLLAIWIAALCLATCKTWRHQ